VRAYSRPGCCLPTSATALNDVRATKPELSFPRRDGGHDHLPFLTRHARPSRALLALIREAVTRGEPRMRPVDRDPAAGSSCLRRFARPRYLDRRATLIRKLSFGLRRAVLRVSLVTIDVHGSLDRAKDVSSSMKALVRRHHEECVRLAHADDVPLLILPEDTRCRRCERLHGNEPHTRERTDQDSRCSGNPRRLPASRESGCLPPLQPRTRERITPLRFPGRPPAHAAHTLPPWLGTMWL
jgi:hypothetical protein